MIVFFVEGRPQVRKRTQFSQKGYFPSDSKGLKRAWAENVRLGGVRAMQDHRMIPQSQPFFMSMDFFLPRPKNAPKDQKYPTSKRSGDDDNYAYLVTNALKGVCYEDDSHRAGHSVMRIYSDNWFGVRVKIWELK